jgi:hypothetical protein
MRSFTTVRSPVNAMNKGDAYLAPSDGHGGPPPSESMESLAAPPKASAPLYQSVIAMFVDEAAVARAIEDLQASASYQPSEIGVAMRDRDAQGRLIDHSGSHAFGGAGVGAVSGGVLGGVAGWLVALGVIAIPGLGPILAGGALAAALGVTAGATVAGAGLGLAAGGLVGALVGMGIPEHDANYYDKHFREGRVIVSVRARDISRAVEILEKHGGVLRSTTAATPSRY